MGRGRLEPLAVRAAMVAFGLLPEAFGRAASYEIVRSLRLTSVHWM